jgi:hypothetical protein
MNFLNKPFFEGEELLIPRPTPKLEDHPNRLSATAYSIYSQLPSISGILVKGNVESWADCDELL